MARPGLEKHPKFRRLMHMLGERKSHVRGYLECLWETAYETGNPVIGDEVDVELAADWPGEPGKLAAALLNCGGEGRTGFIEEVVTDCNALNNGLRNSVTKTFQVHDLFDHAPEYVTHRRTKEVERRKEKTCQRCGNVFHSTETHAKFCSDNCRVSAYRERHSEAATTGPQHPVTDGNGGLRFCNAPLRTVTGSNEPPAPAPAPAPAFQLGLGSGVPEPMSAGADPSTNGNGKKVKEAPKGLLRLIELWNQIGGVQPCRYPTPKRIASYQQRAKNDNWMNLVKEALQKVAASAFCRGHNDRGWLADIDWFLKPDTVTKIIEGKYDNHGQPTRVADIPTGGRPIYNPETGEIVLAKE